MSVVLDASALLAYLQAEPGSDEVGAVLDGAVFSTGSITFCGSQRAEGVV